MEVVMADSDILDMFDHLCWYLCDGRERFIPPEETSEKSLADRNTDELEEAEARGYHRGSLAQLDGVIDFIEMYDIDVEERAHAYVDDDNDLKPPKTREELKAVMNSDE